jgi:hypothetical protein
MFVLSIRELGAVRLPSSCFLAVLRINIMKWMHNAEVNFHPGLLCLTPTSHEALNSSVLPDTYFPRSSQFFRFAWHLLPSKLSILPFCLTPTSHEALNSSVLPDTYFPRSSQFFRFAWLLLPAKLSILPFLKRVILQGKRTQFRGMPYFVVLHSKFSMKLGVFYIGFTVLHRWLQSDCMDHTTTQQPHKPYPTKL